jgi:hypothetical protein
MFSVKILEYNEDEDEHEDEDNEDFLLGIINVFFDFSILLNSKNISSLSFLLSSLSSLLFLL